MDKAVFTNMKPGMMLPKTLVVIPWTVNPRTGDLEVQVVVLEESAGQDDHAHHDGLDQAHDEHGEAHCPGGPACARVWLVDGPHDLGGRRSQVVHHSQIVLRGGNGHGRLLLLSWIMKGHDNDS